MDRRQLLTQIAAFLTTVGILSAPKLSAVEKDAAPALFVLEVADVMNPEQITALTENLRTIVRGTPFPLTRCVVINGGARLSVYDTHGVLINVPMVAL